MMENVKNVPALRFKGDSENAFLDWEENRLGDVSDVRDGTHDSPKYVDEGFPLITSKNLLKNGTIGMDDINFISVKDFDNINRRSMVSVGDILFGMIGTIGNPVLVKNAGFAIKNVALLKAKARLLNAFLVQYLNGPQITRQFHHQNTGGTQKFLSLSIVRSLYINVPHIDEQQKIANFLSAIDDKIQQLTRKKELLEQYKKGVMQQLFSQKLRFKDDDGNEFPDWEEKLLRQVAERVTTKNKVGNTNVLTISAQQGLIGQLDYFNRSVAARDLSGYYLLSRDDFAYNKSYSAGYPMGAIKRLNRYVNGVVSTLYICFRMNGTLDNTFAEQYFESGIHNKEIEKVAQEGARNHGLLNIGVADFFNISLTIPCKSEQTKIANFLSAIDDKIQGLNQQIEHTRQFKKGLLQQMFV